MITAKEYLELRMASKAIIVMDATNFVGDADYNKVKRSYKFNKITSQEFCEQVTPLWENYKGEDKGE